ncbi:cation diffusion facilitator family transporter [Acholeplasma granularum]|uniref:cation diffusion facilitator family transporter n=1 Tax=Acholeplasma granularum TaxID=264635 RepID=UPI0004713F23|nr:cation diffusion facilitator family transporter [Acholeplasma granularum]
MKKNAIRHVVIISLIGNIILTLIKLIFGYLGNSESLISDGVNSFVDIFISLMLLVILKVAHKDADDNHPYGHQKYEGIIYLLLSIIIIIVGFFLGYSGLINLIDYIKDPSLFIIPKYFSILAASVSLIIKLFLFTINYKTAKKYQSVALYGDSKNHLFDIFSTLISLTSIIFAVSGFIYFESIATMIIAMFILYSGIKMIKEAISFLVDEAPKENIVESIYEHIIKCNGVIKIDDLKVRKHMSELYVDVEIAVDKNLSLKEAHNIAENVHDHIESNFDVIHCMVHVNPYKSR